MRVGVLNLGIVSDSTAKYLRLWKIVQELFIKVTNGWCAIRVSVQRLYVLVLGLAKFKELGSVQAL